MASYFWHNIVVPGSPNPPIYPIYRLRRSVWLFLVSYLQIVRVYIVRLHMKMCGFLKIIKIATKFELYDGTKFQNIAL